MAKFACSECDHKQTVSDEHIGKRTKCPKCGKTGFVSSVAEVVLSESVTNDSSEKSFVIRQSGGSIQTRLSRSIILNKESSLEREFITIIDKTLPAELTSCVGVTTEYERETDYTSGRYVYASHYSIKALEDIRAFEIRFLLFNIWGRHVQTLSATEIADIAADSIKHCESKWNLYNENEASEYYASIAYLALIRTSAGVVVKADIEPVIAEGKRICSKLNDSDLEPTPRPR